MLKPGNIRIKNVNTSQTENITNTVITGLKVYISERLDYLN